MKLKIYKRGDIYWGRTYINKEYDKSSGKTELRISSKSSNEKVAKKYLENWFLDICYEIRHGKFLGTIPILHLINKYDDYLTREFELKRVKENYFKNHQSKIRPIVRFITKNKIKNFTNKTLKIDYLDFRKTENSELRNNSLRLEINALRNVMNYALDNEWVTKSDIPQYPSFKRQDNRRTFFRPDEYKKLLRTSKDRIEQSQSKETKFFRQRLHYWIIFSTGSGLRPSETENLCFADVAEFSRNNEKFLRISVKDGKTGSREVVTESSSYYAIIKLKELYLANGIKLDRNTKIFQTKTFSKSLRNLLIACNLRTDQRTNKTRDSKSFRQTYISWEIIKNKRNLHWIAKNCGNSIEVINSNYANNLQHEDFFEEKIVAIPIL